MLLVENIDTLVEIVDSGSFARRVEASLLPELRVLIRSFLTVQETAGATIERDRPPVGRPLDGNLDLANYVDRLHMNNVNQAQVTRLALNLEQNIRFELGSQAKTHFETGPINSEPAGSDKGGQRRAVDRSRFQLKHHVFYFSAWAEGDKTEEAERPAPEGEEGEVEEVADEAVIDFEEPRTGQPRRPGSRGPARTKGTDIIKNLDGLNISDSLKAKFLQCVKPQNKK